MKTGLFMLGVAAALGATSASAQSAGNEQQGSHNPAIKDRSAHQVTAPAEGSNSFTEDQARKRLAKAGYAVSQLSKDDNGVWRGTATKGGKSMTVGLDYKGNITTR